MTAVIQISPEAWDIQYREGSWDHLKGYMAHYAVVGALVRKYAAVSVLDVGCGEGLLRRFLYDSPGYMGIDISVEAISKTLGDGFVVAEAESFVPGRFIDCAVFCESLYYISNPLEVVGRYLHFAKFAVVSIFLSDSTKELIEGLKTRFKVLDDYQVINLPDEHEVMVLELPT